MNLFKEVELNTEEKSRQTCRNIDYEAGAALSTLKRVVKDSFDAVWNNPSATPQQIMDVFGVNAGKLFYVSSETQQFIKKLDPDYVYMVSPNEITINPDGTVVIGDPIVPEPEPTPE